MKMTGINFMKNLMLGVVLLCIPFIAAENARAQPSYGVFSGAFPLTLTNAQTVTVNSNPIYVRKNQGVAITPLQVSGDAANGAVTYTFDVSIDGTNYTTLTPFTYAPAHNGTTLVVGYTNWSSTILNNVRFMKLRSIANAHTNSIYVTNVYYGFWT